MLGLIADDFTGASDAASFLAAAGASTRLYSGVPSEVNGSCDAAVVALKTRTCSVDEAVTETLAAWDVLRRGGAQRYYLKYCSTFDSTPNGNIGPTVDALMERMGVDATVLDPALPVNGRTLRDGVLYVGGVPLAESSMKDHPLTPMWASSLRELMAKQGRHEVVDVPLTVLRNAAALTELRQQVRHSGRKVYFVPDHWEDEHAALIAECFDDLPLLTGGSALAGAWGARFAKGCKRPNAGARGRCLLLAGSCSVATRAQIEAWRRAGRPVLHLRPEALSEGIEAEVDRLLQQLGQEDCLVYASGSPDEVARMKAVDGQIDVKIERALAKLAVCAAAGGVTKWIVAGGETSGAVTRALGLHSFAIGPSVAPGVPVLLPLERPDCRLILKSGNFGEADFFLKAWEMTSGDG